MVRKKGRTCQTAPHFNTEIIINLFSDEKVLMYCINMTGKNEEFTSGYLLNICKRQNYCTVQLHI